MSFRRTGCGSAATFVAWSLMAAYSIAWTARGQRLGIAATPVSIPTLFNVANIVAFAIGVTMYGF